MSAFFLGPLGVEGLGYPLGIRTGVLHVLRVYTTNLIVVLITEYILYIHKINIS